MKVDHSGDELGLLAVDQDLRSTRRDETDEVQFLHPSGRIPPARLRGTPPSDPLLPDPDLAPLLQADPVVKHETITLPGGRLIGIDPAHRVPVASVAGIHHGRDDGDGARHCRRPSGEVSDLPHGLSPAAAVRCLRVSRIGDAQGSP